MGKKYCKEKVPKLYQAKRALIAYMKEHDIDPADTKRIEKDPTLKDLVFKLNKERDKVMLSYPSLDRLNNIKLLQMAKDKKTKKKIKPQNEEEVKEVKVKKSGRVATKYDYPQVKDEKTGKMRDMTKDEKKKYRVEQRKKAAAADKPSISKKDSKSSKEAPVKENKKKKAKKEDEPKASKKAKKAKKDED